MIKFSTVTSMDEIDFDRLFEGSLEYMDANFVWPEGVTTTEEKKAVLHRLATFGVSGQEIMGGKLYAHKVSIDGADTAFGYGIMRDGELEQLFGLMAPDLNGSRAFIYDDAYLAEYQSFLDSQGVVSRKFQVIPGGTSESMLTEKRGFVVTEQIESDNSPTLNVVSSDVIGVKSGTITRRIGAQSSVSRSPGD